ncbi:MAG TPA: S1C family serine protease [candidate division Zixibacteria bacterium]|nr:S1C family serine protease [candidate division Zixibacteria bacterium]
MRNRTDSSRVCRRVLIWAPLLTLLVISGVVADQSVNAVLRLDQQIQELVARLSPAVVTVQAASRRSELSELGRALNTTEPIVLSGIPALVIDTGGYLLCAATALPSGGDMSLELGGLRYRVQRVGIDYRSGLALLRAVGADPAPVEFSEEATAAGALSLFLSAPTAGRVEPLLTIAAGESQMEGYVEFNGPQGSGVAGGAIFDMSGRLLAVTLGSIEGAGGNRIFAAPASRIAPIVSRLRCCGDRPAGYLGVQVVDTEIHGIELGLRSAGAPGAARFASASQQTTDGAPINGALLTVVESASPAEAAGLRVGDVIYRYDDHAVSSAAALRDYVRGCAPDSVIHFALLRGSSRFERAVTMGAAPLQSQFSQSGGVQSLDGQRTPSAGLVDSLVQLIQRLEARVRSLEERERNR